MLWETSALAEHGKDDEREAILKAYSSPAYRAHRLPGRAGWTDQVVALDLLLRSLATVDDFDLTAVREQVNGAASAEDAERAAGLLDATLIASLAHRYLESPEGCLFLGDQTHGYVILPADAFIRSLAGDKRPAPKVLFPQESLRQRLGSKARLRSADLLHIPGRPQRIEASFESRPRYEFDNVDEMLWWKHTRHLEGPALPTEGLCDLVVHLGADDGNGEDTLRLVRSRHRTLSFRFDPPSAWRTHMPTRDGKTYAFRVRRAVYETDSSA